MFLPKATRVCIIHFSCWLTVGGDRFMVDPLLSCAPMLECLLMGSPPPGVPPGELAHEGAMRILGVISVLSDRRRLGKAFTTRRKFESGDDGDAPNHHPPSVPPGIIFLHHSMTAFPKLWAAARYQSARTYKTKLPMKHKILFFTLRIELVIKNKCFEMICCIKHFRMTSQIS